MPIMHIKKKIYLFVLVGIILSSCGRDEAGRGMASVPVSGSSRLSELLRDDDEQGFRKAIEPHDFRFPTDHGAHPQFRNEWWYLTGNLDAGSGERFGYELTIFRFSLSPQTPSTAVSGWQTNQVFIGHLALTDVDAGNFHAAQRYSRGSVGLAGAKNDPVHVWLDDWSIGKPDEMPTWNVRARDEEFAIELGLVAEKPIVLNGDNGLSQKSAEVGNASYYYSIPRLGTEGTVTVGEREYEVSGLSWLDREWGSSALSRDQQGWDWFALQLSDGSDLMFYVLRGTDGEAGEFSSGTWISPAGDAEHLSRDDVDIEVTNVWENSAGDHYPAGWRIRLPRRDLSMKVKPVLANQELVTNVRYWEGAVDVEGEVDGRSIDGRGYVELTGYAGN